MLQEAISDRFTSLEKVKMHADDRIMHLELVDENAKNSGGLLDNRLFKGGNRLHAIRHPLSSLWYMRYDNGILPQQLRQRFSGFNKLHAYASDYFRKRGVKIARVEG